MSTQRPFHKVQVLNQTKRHQHLDFLGLTVSISCPFPFMKTRPFYYIRRLQYLRLFGRDLGVSISRLPMEARTVLVKSSIFAFSGSQEFTSLAFPEKPGNFHLRNSHSWLLAWLFLTILTRDSFLNKPFHESLIIFT